MNAERCTAVVTAGETPPNILFTPPCTCPRCAPDRHYEPRTVDDGWLRLPGREQRYRVELLDLGATGRAVLG